MSFGAPSPLVYSRWSCADPNEGDSKGLALTWYRALTWYSSSARPFVAPDDPQLITGQQGSPSHAYQHLSRALNVCAGGSSEGSTKSKHGTKLGRTLAMHTYIRNVRRTSFGAPPPPVSLRWSCARLRMKEICTHIQGTEFTCILYLYAGRVWLQMKQMCAHKHIQGTSGLSIPARHRLLYLHASRLLPGLTPSSQSERRGWASWPFEFRVNPL